jgi:carboxymethylenebutenolidase
MTERVAFKSKAGDEASGALALPPGTGVAPALVLIQEYWGLNAHVESLAERFAAEGFVVLAPDLYRGQVTKSAEEAGRLMKSLDYPRAFGDVGGAVEYLRHHARSNGKVAITGFCLGGAITLAAAASAPSLELAAAVPFYGVPWHTDYTKITCPVQAHFCATDEWAKPSIALDIQKTVQERGGSMEVNVYDAKHAFMNDTRPEVYSPDDAKLAWGRAVAFLKQHAA